LLLPYYAYVVRQMIFGVFSFLRDRQGIDLLPVLFLLLIHKYAFQKLRGFNVGFYVEFTHDEPIVRYNDVGPARLQPLPEILRLPFPCAGLVIF
jgi:hypothetical protein